MLIEMKSLVKKNNICVLATVADGKPHCSLMAYVTDENCEEIYMVTLRNSQKYKNLTENPSVSILIDTRESSPRAAAKALTVAGLYAVIQSKEKQEKIQARLLSVHPHLTDFINHSEAEILCIEISSFLLLKGLQDAYFESIKS
jgi:nitroimidazol reductase NimA-like FMN-containing flavoprotein (pyridoxamine 5'-phosphate oxidase superfamily)